MDGVAVAAAALQVELQGAAQVAQDGRLALVGVGQHLVVKRQVARLAHQGDALAGIDGKVDVFQQQRAADAEVDALQGDQGHAPL